MCGRWHVCYSSRLSVIIIIILVKASFIEQKLWNEECGCDMTQDVDEWFCQALGQFNTLLRTVP